MTFNCLSNQVQRRCRERTFWSVVPQSLDAITIVCIVLGNEGTMRLFVVVLNEFLEPVSVRMSECEKGRISIEVMDVSVCFKLQEHRKKEAGDMLSSALEFDELLRKRMGAHWRDIVENDLLIRIYSIHSIWICPWVFNVLRESNQPVHSQLLIIILYGEESMGWGDNRLDIITLGYLTCFYQDQICEFLRKWSIVAAKIVDDIKVISWKLDHLLQKCIMPHTILLSFTYLISFLQQKSKDLQRMFKLGSIMHVS